MGGINDIKTAFTRAAPKGTTLKSVTMIYDGDVQVFTFAMAKSTGEETVDVRIAGHATPEVVVDMALNAGTIEQLPKPPSVSSIYSAAQLIGGDAPILQEDFHAAANAEADKAIEAIKNGDYELVDDGAPPPKPALFF